MAAEKDPPFSRDTFSPGGKQHVLFFRVAGQKRVVKLGGDLRERIGPGCAIKLMIMWPLMLF